MQKMIKIRWMMFCRKVKGISVDKYSKLGLNIQSLRMAYGETQEELGKAINVGKNTVSNYENGLRTPNNEILARIADHYLVSVEELLNGDFSNYGKIQFDIDNGWKGLDIILPIFKSNKALLNEHFKKAFDENKRLYKHIIDNKEYDFEDDGDALEYCMDEYLEAMDDDSCKNEAAANYIACWFLQTGCFNFIVVSLKNKSAILTLTAENKQDKEELKEEIKKLSWDGSIDLFNDYLNEMNTGEEKKIISDLLIELKSKGYSDLVDYYLALQYVFGIVDNDLGFGLNIKIGKEMMQAFLSVKNYYVARYLRFMKKVHDTWTDKK